MTNIIKMFMSKNVVGDDLVLRSGNPEQDLPQINGFLVEHILSEAKKIGDANKDLTFCVDAGIVTLLNQQT